MAIAKALKRMTVIVDTSLCLGCRSCELACAVAHSEAKTLYGVIASGEKPGHRINVEACGRMAVPLRCNQCADAACVLVCPTGAVYREAEGEPVLFDADRCIGCGMCVQACPFGVIVMSADGKRALKCDMCVERLERGEEPACANACPTGALVFGDAEDAGRAKRRKAAQRVLAAMAGAEKATQD